ncbi:MAG: DUF429 domain-containing protein [Gemmataceae bacterium]|nr:DUF429 domain-containing protein [Gemmataceae bacterium]
MTPHVVVGVDFSGAKMAGANTWLARLDVTSDRPRLVQLDCLESLAGVPEREAALKHLVELIRESQSAVWAIDFPFGLPIEVPGCHWPEQVPWLEAFGGDAYAAGLECVRIAKSRGLPAHVRRATDVEAKTPFDCYHYRIVYQMYHGITSVLAPLRKIRRTAILPFHYPRLPGAERVVVEACPSSTLKRLALPHQNYKQPAGGPLSAVRLRTRRTILDRLQSLIELTTGFRRIMMRNPGGDALDAVIAAVGGWQAFRDADHAAIARHPRYRHEGRLYV